MFRRKFLALAATAGMMMSMPALALTEGTDYVKLDAPIPNAENTVIKVFSYDCPFCYKYAVAVDKTVMAKVPGMNFVPFHLKTKGKYGLEGSNLLALALVKDEVEGLKPLDPKSNFHKIEMALYTAYHRKQERWNAGADAFLKTGLDAVGWTKAQYETGIQDPKVQALVASWDAGYPVAKIQGVPAYVVDGKYLLMTKNIRSIDGMAKMIEELAAK